MPGVTALAPFLKKGFVHIEEAFSKLSSNSLKLPSKSLKKTIGLRMKAIVFFSPLKLGVSMANRADNKDGNKADDKGDMDICKGGNSKDVYICNTVCIVGLLRHCRVY